MLNVCGELITATPGQFDCCRVKFHSSWPIYDNTKNVAKNNEGAGNKCIPVTMILAASEEGLLLDTVHV